MSPSPNGPFGFTGVYATNSATAPGRFSNNGVSVPNWAAGARMFYQVAAWHSSLGPTFNPSWLGSPPPGPFSLSLVGSGVAGGNDSQGQPYPPPPLFGGMGITSGLLICCLPDIPIVADPYQIGIPFRFHIYGVTGTSLVIEASTNLTPQSWIALPGGTLSTNAGIYFSDPEWTNYPKRFYRVRWVLSARRQEARGAQFQAA